MTIVGAGRQLTPVLSRLLAGGASLVSMNVRVGLRSSPVVLETVCNDNLMFRTKYVVVDLYVRQCLAHHRSCYTETENSLTRSDTLISSTRYCIYYKYIYIIYSNEARSSIVGLYSTIQCSLMFSPQLVGELAALLTRQQISSM